MRIMNSGIVLSDTTILGLWLYNYMVSDVVGDSNVARTDLRFTLFNAILPENLPMQLKYICKKQTNIIMSIYIHSPEYIGIVGDTASSATR